MKSIPSFLKNLFFFLPLICLYNLGNAQVRFISVDPSGGQITIKNFGSTTIDVSTWRLCNFPNYQLLSSSNPSGSLNMAPGAEVTVNNTVNLMNNDGELGLYINTSWSSPSSMRDYLQWGSSGHQRESVANSAGYWTSGTFLQPSPPFTYVGDGTQNGVNFWNETLSIEDFNLTNDLRFEQNPTENRLVLITNNELNSFSYDILDIGGKMVITKKSFAEDNSIDVSPLESGLYFLSIYNESVKTVKRFVKK